MGKCVHEQITESGRKSDLFVAKKTFSFITRASKCKKYITITSKSKDKKKRSFEFPPRKDLKVVRKW
jgi:hypothetical protein